MYKHSISGTVKNLLLVASIMFFLPINAYADSTTNCTYGDWRSAVGTAGDHQVHMIHQTNLDYGTFSGYYAGDSVGNVMYGTSTCETVDSGGGGGGTANPLTVDIPVIEVFAGVQVFIMMMFFGIWLFRKKR